MATPGPAGRRTMTSACALLLNGYALVELCRGGKLNLMILCKSERVNLSRSASFFFKPIWQMEEKRLIWLQMYLQQHFANRLFKESHILWEKVSVLDLSHGVIMMVSIGGLTQVGLCRTSLKCVNCTASLCLNLQKNTNKAEHPRTTNKPRRPF